MPIFKLKCLSCQMDYNAFIFPGGQGWNLKQYQCPYCGSIKKAAYKGQDISKVTEGFSSIKDKIQTKIFHIKSSEDKKNGISK